MGGGRTEVSSLLVICPSVPCLVGLLTTSKTKASWEGKRKGMKRKGMKCGRLMVLLRTRTCCIEITRN